MGAWNRQPWFGKLYVLLLAAIGAGSMLSQSFPALAVPLSVNARLDALESAVSALQAQNASQAIQIASLQTTNAALQSALTAEVAARQAADAALQTAITSEATARQGAITGLQSSLSSEILSRQSGDATLQGSINAETAARQAADAALHTNPGIVTGSTGVDSGAIAEFFVECFPGQDAVGGGFEVSSPFTTIPLADINYTLFASEQRDGNANHWHFKVRADDPAGATFAWRVQCATLLQ